MVTNRTRHLPRERVNGGVPDTYATILKYSNYLRVLVVTKRGNIAVHEILCTRYSLYYHVLYTVSYTYVYNLNLFVRPWSSQPYNTYRSFAPDDTLWKKAVIVGRRCVSYLSLLPPPVLVGLSRIHITRAGFGIIIQIFSASVYIFRAKRVSNCYMQEKKNWPSVCPDVRLILVLVWKNCLGFSVGYVLCK